MTGGSSVTLRGVTPRLPVRDLAKSLQFYRDVLGFTDDVLWPDDEPTFAIVRRGGAHIGLFTGDRAGPEQRGYVELYIEVDDATALHDELEPRWPIAWGPEVYSYGRREFAVIDPDGYMVIITEPTDDPPTTAEPDAEDCSRWGET